MATYRKRGPYQWQAIVRKKGYPPVTKTFETRKDAEEWAREVEREMDRGIYIGRPTNASKLTLLDDLLKRYEIDILPGMRGSHYPSTLKKLRTELGRYAIAAITPTVVAELRRKRQAEGLAASTVKKEINLLSTVLKIATSEWGCVLPTGNPCTTVQRPRERNSRERRLEPGEAGALMAELDIRLGYLVCVAIETAGRAGELLELEWQDVDFEARRLIIRGIRHEGLERRTKNDDAYRVIPLSKTAVAALEDIRREWPDNKYKKVFRWKNVDSIDNPWRKACRAASIQDLRFHDLRHEATSRLFERTNLGEMEIASITGHKSLVMLKRYTHLRTANLLARLDQGRMDFTR